MYIHAMITGAQMRQRQRQEEWKQRAEEERLGRIERAKESFLHTFGADLLQALDIGVEDEGSYSMLQFSYQDKTYNLFERVLDYSTTWYLTRLDPRSEEDERRLPRREFQEIRRDQEGNRDSLLLNLVELAAEPEAAPLPKYQPDTPRHTPSPADVLVDAIREYVEHVISEYKSEEY